MALKKKYKLMTRKNAEITKSSSMFKTIQKWHMENMLAKITVFLIYISLLMAL